MIWDLREDIDFDVLLDEKSYENVSIHDGPSKHLWVQKCCVRFDKVDGITEIYNWTRYLELFGQRIYNTIYERINYLMSGKSDTKFIINHNFARIRIDSHNSLPIEKTLFIML